MKALLALGAIGAFALGAQPAIAQDNTDDDTLILEPSSEWRLREMDDRCRLSRVFGEGENRTTLWIDKAGEGPMVNLTLLGAPLRHPYGPYIEAAFEPAGPVSRNYISLTSSQGRPVIVMYGVNPLSAPQPSEARSDGEDPAAVRSLRLSRALIRPVSLEIDGLEIELEALADCSTDLLEKISAAFGDGSGLARGAVATEQRIWAREIQQAYPRHLLARGQEGSVSIRLVVNKKGRASFCEVTDYEGPASFNETVCLLLQRHAKFIPGRDAEGNATTSLIRTQVTFSLD